MKEEVESKTPKWAGLFFIIILVSCIGFTRSQNYPKYKNSDQALSDIWDKLKKSQRYPQSLDSSTYIFVSPMIFEKRSQIQIINFKNYVTEESMIFTHTPKGWIPKPTPSEEKVIIKLFEYCNNPETQLIDIIINWIKKLMKKPANNAGLFIYLVFNQIQFF